MCLGTFISPIFIHNSGMLLYFGGGGGLDSKVELLLSFL